VVQGSILGRLSNIPVTRILEPGWFNQRVEEGRGELEQVKEIEGMLWKMARMRRDYKQREKVCVRDKIKQPT
jgi:hypothetical protein